MPYAPALSTLQQQAAQAYYRHADDPRRLGPADEHERLWTLLHEARCVSREQNPAFAATLLPILADSTTAPTTGAGLPVLPVGIRAVVDGVPGQVKVTLDVAGPVSLQIVSPQSSLPYAAAVTSAPTRATATFTAPADGLYTLLPSSNGSALPTVYVPVLRAEWRRFREQVRALGYAFTSRRPALPAAARARLARLIWAEAAAYAGDAPLFANLVASLAAVPVADSPVALYPHG